MIFRDVLLSRFYSRSFVDLTSFRRLRGFILHGPSSTGKTLIAKTIADILNVHVKIDSEPQLLNWLLGEPEAKIRQLLEKVHSDQEKYGPQNLLHLIIFNQINAICKQ